ncbi:3-oxoacyl-[acyl-carrier-protein] reductase FabG [Pigmentiphaga humi]|uniref:3-oxoacyl-[acyl-carrier-protein] reductase FabG n=1 Tax=Pigmentiphaga humi TaxID=2478468 RepID=A0A3P4AYU6_9BURK|nr:SDR family oxidoreductase [Pigmentiphaga humi]VCU68942.1 3-oxoacyl-[acyl-carrier-protein] reductase FabG [Pigmentiphaga humi]
MRVFITGASSGIGQALARHYATRGATLGLVGRREEALRDLAAGLPGGGHRHYALDVRDRAALHAAGRDFLAAGGIDLVVANAGISVGTLTEETGDFEAFRAVIDTNLTAMVATFEPFIPAMKQARRGQLAGIASVAGIRGLPGAGAYSASKAAVIAYCESLRNELSPHGIRVSTIAPGYIRTPMTAHNPYAMPFLMDADVFAGKAARALDRSASYAVIPWQMGVVAKLMRLLPDAVYDHFAVRAPRKPRQS